MRCTQCSRPLRPIVVYDVDGTLADYHGAFTAFAGEYWDVTPRPYAYLEPWSGEGEFEDYLGLTKVQYREAKLAYRQGGNKRWLAPFSGMPTQVRSVRERQVDIWIATTRPWNRLDNVDPDTQEWLRRHNLTVDGLLYGEDKFRQLMETVDPMRIVAVVEDLAAQIDVAVGLGLPVIQVERPHNSDPGEKRDPRGNVETVGEWVHSKIDEWQKNNEPIGAF